MSRIRPWTNGDQVPLEGLKVPVVLYDAAGNPLVLDTDSRVPTTAWLNDSAGDPIVLDNGNLPTVVNSIKGRVSLDNSTQIPLAGGASFTGLIEDVTNYAITYVGVFTDQDGTLSVEKSSDGVTWDIKEVYSVYANLQKEFSITPSLQYLRVTYLNGAVAQTVFRVSTVFKSVYGKPSSHNLEGVVVPDDDAELVKAVITGYDKDSSLFKNVRVNTEGRLKVEMQPYLYSVAEGQVPGHYGLYKFGSNTSAGTTEESVWEEGGLYPWAAIDAAPGIVTISSSSAADSGIAVGTGVRTVTIYGLDVATGAEQQETLTTNGTTAVNSTLSYRRVFRVICNTAGTGLKNAGTIYVGTGAVVAGKPTVVWALAAIGTNQTLQAIWTVPFNTTAYLTHASFSVNGSKGASASVYMRPPGELFQVKYLANLAGGVESFSFDSPLVLNALTDIDARTVCGAINTDVGAVVQGWYELN